MKNLLSGPYDSPKAINAVGLKKSLVVKASSGALLELHVYNSKSSEQYIQIFDTAAVPADAVVPLRCYRLPAKSSLDLDFGLTGRPFATGIVVCNSSTDTTKTIAADDCFIDAIYR